MSESFLNFVTAGWLGFIGACLGSFLNVVAYRMPQGMSVVWKPSHCPKCGHAIRAYDNVPVLGWLWLKGKCRDCGQPISPRYAVVELVMGLAFFSLAYAELFTGGANLPGGPITEFTGALENVIQPQWPLLSVYAFHGLLLSLVMGMALIDGNGQRIPAGLLLFGLVCVVAFRWLAPGSVTPLLVTSESPIVSWAIKGCCLVIAGLVVWLLWGGKFWGESAEVSAQERNFLLMLVTTWLFLGGRLMVLPFLFWILPLVIWKGWKARRGDEPTSNAGPLLFAVVLMSLVTGEQVWSLLPG